MKNKMKFLTVILSLGIICTAYFGDYLVFKSKYANSFVFRAVADSVVHGSIGFLSSLIFFTYETSLNSQATIYNVIFCTMLSSFIDIDHFIVARSVHLKDLVHLKHRGIFHSTTFFILISIILLVYSYLQKKLNIYILNFMLILAYISHHIRDGNRRGLWMYPFGTSPPINKYLYILLLAVLPHLIARFYLFFKLDFRKNTFVDYATVV